MDELLEHAGSILSTTPSRWRTLTATVRADLLARRPAPGEWSAVDCLRHLVATEREVFPVRVDAILAGRDFAAYDPDAAAARVAAEDSEDLVTAFGQARARSLQRLQSVTPDDLRRTGRHPDLGTVTLRELIHTWAGHDLMHTVQGERALLQPFIAGSGPWRGYFADHDVERLPEA